MVVRSLLEVSVGKAWSYFFTEVQVLSGGLISRSDYDKVWASSRPAERHLLWRFRSTFLCNLIYLQMWCLQLWWNLPQHLWLQQTAALWIFSPDSLPFSRRHECRQPYPGLSLSIQYTKRIENWWTGESPTLQCDWLCQRSNVEHHPTVTWSQKPLTTQSPWLELISMSSISNNFQPGTSLHLMASLRHKRKVQVCTSQFLGVEASNICAEEYPPPK